MAFNGRSFNFSISPEKLDEKGKDIWAICGNMRSSLGEIETALKALESWNSGNKIKFEAKIKNALPKMYELVEVIESFGGVARQTASRILSTENRISAALEAE